MTRLQAALKIKPGEGRMVALVIGLMLFTSAGGSIGGNGIEALLYARYGVKSLPYLYMGLGAITLLTALAITALLGRLPRERLYVILPVALAFILISERFVVALKLNWFYPVMWLGMNVIGSLQGLLTWGLAGVVCDTRQAKRLFPLFSAGGILGAVVGGLGTRPLVNLLNSENLLLVWAGALLVAFVLGLALVGRAPARAVSRTRRARRRTPKGVLEEIQQGYQVVRRSPLMQWMSMAVVLFSMLFFSLAFPFSKAATAQFPDADALAGFLGLFQGLSTGAACLASLFLVNRLFARFGLMPMILALPVIYLLGFGAVTVYAAFPVLVAFRFVQTFWLSGIAGTAYQAMFNVVPAERRDQTRTFLDGVPGQAGTVIAGLTLVVGEQALRPQQLYLIGLGAAVVTTYLVWRAGRAYSGALVEALRAGQPQVFFGEEEPFGGFQRDATAVSVAVGGLSDPDPTIRRVSAEILGNVSVPGAVDALVSALRDPEVYVRTAVLRALARAQASPALLDVAACLKDPEPEVRAQAADTLSRLTPYPQGLYAYVRPLMDDPESSVNARAAVALLRAGPNTEARDLLRYMAAMGDLEARANALDALGEVGDAEAFELVATELSDEYAPPAARRAAASALARFADQADRSVELLIHTLSDRSVRDAATAALGRIGQPALEKVMTALENPALESGALAALERLNTRGVAPALRAYAQKQVAHTLDYHALFHRLDVKEEDERTRLLSESVRAKALSHATRALRAVGMLSDRASMTLALDNLKSRNPAQRANALETLEAIGEPHIVRPLLALWEQSTAEGAAPVNESLPRLLSDGDAWLRACAALAADDATDHQLRTTLAQLAQSDPDAIVRETAALALNADTARPTLSRMERILFLRRVPLFADLSPAELKRVAAIAAERDYADGAIIAAQGAPGDEMFLIVSGEVRVLAAAGNEMPSEVARRKSGEYVGEMAIISQEPRMASLVCAGPVRVLCVDRTQFEGLLREQPEIRLAVMRGLCARLREQTVGVTLKA